MRHLQFVSVSFSYPGHSTDLFSDLSFDAPPGWTGIVGPNGIGKTTVLELAAGLIAPTAGEVARPDPAIVCEQRTDRPPDALNDLLSYPDADAGRLASILSLEADWPYRWESLSHGERKRAQIAVALWREPGLLAVDEPTNHLDRDARDHLLTALGAYTGVGLIVSHDRAALDRLCDRCLFLEPGCSPLMRRGGVSAGMEQRERERLESHRAYDRARAEQTRIEAEAARRSREALTQNRKRSKAGLDRHDSDGRARIDAARVSGADGHAGRLLRQMDGRRAQAAARLSGIDRPVRERVGVSVHGERARSDRLLHRPAGAIDLPDGRTVGHPELLVAPDDRIALGGPNGAGKSTLIARLLAEGRGSDRVTERILWIPQEISASAASRLIRDVRALGNDRLARVVSTVSRLGSDPDRLLQTELPSPGETRKLMLALGLERSPSLIVMDEPTNHLDLTSIECVEAALADYAGALLLISHDRAFTRALTKTRWEICDGVLEICPAI